MASFVHMRGVCAYWFGPSVNFAHHHHHKCMKKHPSLSKSSENIPRSLHRCGRRTGDPLKRKAWIYCPAFGARKNVRLSSPISSHRFHTSGHDFWPRMHPLFPKLLQNSYQSSPQLFPKYFPLFSQMSARECW
jgi:hypothetical protein